MINIFNRESSQKLVDRLEKLTPESKPQWGKMTVSQMLWHCQKPIEVVEGRLMLQGGLLGFLFGKMAKKSFLKNRGFSKNSPTAPEFKTTQEPEFEKEKTQLISLVKKFGEKGTAVIAVKKHPFFGEMTEDEWGSLMYIHLDHHLTQFGV